MARLTITLPNALHQALKEAAARRQTTIGELIAESIEFYGIKTEARAADLVRQARDRSGLPESEAIELATREARAAREG